MAKIKCGHLDCEYCMSLGDIHTKFCGYILLEKRLEDASVIRIVTSLKKYVKEGKL